MHVSNQSQLIAEAQWRQTIRQRLSGDTTLLCCINVFSPVAWKPLQSYYYCCNKAKLKNIKTMDREERW